MTAGRPVSDDATAVAHVTPLRSGRRPAGRGRRPGRNLVQYRNVSAEHGGFGASEPDLAQTDAVVDFHERWVQNWNAGVYAARPIDLEGGDGTRHGPLQRGTIQQKFRIEFDPQQRWI